MKAIELKQLLKQMTISEKIGQLQQLTADFFTSGASEITGPVKEANLSPEMIYQAGSILGVSDKEKVRAIQAEYLAKNRLKIPLLFMADVIHGYKEIFPIPLAMAATWNPELVRQTAEFAAKESYVNGLHVTFSPMVDLVRDPRWGRVMEYNGEDPYLNSRMARAYVQGYQGDQNDLRQPNTIAATVKHFAAYGAVEAGREYNTVDLSRWQLFENYLTGYQAAIDAGAKLVMTSFNIFEGIPVTANEYVLRTVLRDKLGFKGTVISDWDAVEEIINHGTASTGSAAAEQALRAGVDIEMMSFNYNKFLEALVDKGILSVSLIDEAVLRILTLKNELGIFEDPFRGLDATLTEQDQVNGKKLALTAAKESLVLVENKQKALPLDERKSVIVLGSLANTGELLGGWSWHGQPQETESIIAALDHAKIKYRFVDDQNHTALNHLDEISGDSILLFLGEPASQTGEATSKTDLRLTSTQRRLLSLAASSGKKVISIIMSGRPLIDSEIYEKSNAVLLAWYGGSEMAQAICTTIFGKNNPSGKLPMSVPRNVGQIPIYYNHYSTGRPETSPDEKDKYVSKYLDSSNQPRYPFGFGLSYSNFEYGIPKLSSAVLTKTKSIELMVDVTNTSLQSGVETVQLYIHALVGETVRPVKQLINFKRIMLESHETRRVIFTISETDLRYVHSNLQSKSDLGDFEYFIGSDSNVNKKGNFELRDVE